MPTVRNTAQHTEGAVPRVSRGTAHPAGGPSRQRSRKRNKPRKHRDRNPFVDDEAEDGKSEAEVEDEGGPVDEGEWQGVGGGAEFEQSAQEREEVVEVGGMRLRGQGSRQGIENAVRTPQTATGAPPADLNETSEDELGRWEVFDGRVVATLPVRAKKTQGVTVAGPSKKRKTAQERAQEDAAMRSPPHKRLKPAEKALIQSGYTVAPPARPSRAAEPQSTQASASVVTSRRRREEDSAPPVIYYKQALPQTRVPPPGPYKSNEHERSSSISQRFTSKNRPTIASPVPPPQNEVDDNYHDVEPVVAHTASHPTRIQTAPSPPPRTPRYRSPSLEYVDVQPQSRSRSPPPEVRNVDKGKKRMEYSSDGGQRGRSMTRRPISTPPPLMQDDDDIRMQSPQYIPPQGSSRSSGGVLRGNAFGNHPNIADLEDDGYYSDARSVTQHYRDTKSQPKHHRNLQNPQYISQGHHREDVEDEAAILRRHRHQEIEVQSATPQGHGPQGSMEQTGRSQSARRQDRQDQFTGDQPAAPQIHRHQDREDQRAGVIFMIDSDKSPGEVDVNYEKPVQIKVQDISKYTTYKPVIRRTLRDWSPPRHPDNGYRIYYMDTTWTLLGNYSDIMERNADEDDEVSWMPPREAGDKHHVQILCSNYQPSGVVYSHHSSIHSSHPLSLTNRSASLDTSSIGPSRSVSVVATSNAAASTAASSAPTTTSSTKTSNSENQNVKKQFKDYEQSLIDLLNINVTATTDSKNVRLMWMKYLECVKAIQAAKVLSTTRRWPPGLHYTEELIINIFAAKSTWYRRYNSLFSIVAAQAPDMKTWLDEKSTSREEDMDLWGFSVNEYVESDLREWLARRGLLETRAVDEAAEAEARERADRLERLERQMQEREERDRREHAERNRAAIYGLKRRKNTRR